MTELRPRSFNSRMCKRILNLLEAGYLRLMEVVVKKIIVIEFGVNNGGGNGTGIERTDTTKLSNTTIARFGEGRNLFGKGKVFIEDKAKHASTVGGVK